MNNPQLAAIFNSWGEMTDETPTTGPQRAAARLASLDEGQLGRLVAALDSSHRFVSSDQMRETARAALPELDADDVNNLIDFGLAYAEVAFERGLERDPKFLQSIVDRAASDMSEPNDSLAASIQNLLRAPALESVAQSLVAVRGHNNVVIRTTMKTDLRPVFVEAFGDDAASFAVWHTLRVIKTDDMYGEDESIVEFVLDYTDLEAIRDQAIAALARQVSLQATLEKQEKTVWSPYAPEADKKDAADGS